MERKKYPIGAEFYEIFEEIGHGTSASVYRAICIPSDEVVAVKILDFERDNSDLLNISREAQTMILVDHPNVLKAHCSFVSDHNLWVVMPFMAGGSCLHILKAAFPDGFEEVVISTILREVLRGLEYLHHHGHIHRDVKAGNILVDSRGAIKLGDFGVSASLFDAGDRQRARNTFVGTPCWMAPEVMEQLHGYDFKADIWSFGITALELAHGHAPFSKYPPMKVLLMTLQNAPPGLDYERDRKFSKSFKQMIAICLVKNPLKRPSARRLLKHSFFKQARSNEYILRTILDGLPTLGDRIKELKRKEDDMLAQKKMPDGRKEEISQNEYKRGISGWNFDVEDLKAQSSLIQDVEETIPDQDQVGCSNSSFGSDAQMSSCSEYEGADRVKPEESKAVINRSVSLPSADVIVENLKGRCERSDDFNVAVHEHNSSPDNVNLRDDHVRNNFNEKAELDIVGRSLEGKATNSGNKSDEQHLQGQSTVNCNGVVPRVVDDAGCGSLNRSNSSASNVESLDEKGKATVVQQKGRFKVTSENLNSEKAASPMMHKSQSMQVISQHPAFGQQSATDATPNLPSNLGPAYSQLYSMLQANISQQESILSLMKQLTKGDPKANLSICGGMAQPTASSTDKSLLELAHEKEKKLLQEVTDLQWRLICTQEELQKCKMENAQFQ
ncbi:serine/threonine-protein kinase BLUS1-like isoform X1 [Papaver somniferum]|uniref:serine/threonine-protein kinase BLUS1-like isoform X1 n=1 Tax=Papaver somniferum TaxID=3469 RepID=UPI000E6FC060|nr:serine/threonine-protein kinase BLUS1-like isoform X1 [Papaver somniferum]XP_026405909.1 serine/threonine-protein kinase BLUS1-like isoform X1 [Papaver somniferum]